jgi:hypothetical protein
MIYPRLMLAIVLVISSLSGSFAADNAGNLSEISTYIPESGQIHAKQTILSNATFETNISSLLFVLTWLNATSNLEAALIAPSGVKIDSTAQPPVIYGVNKSLIFYILPNAEVGKWTAMITAKDVPDVGESYWALFGTIPENEYTNQDLNDLENTDEECQNCAEKS